MRAQIAALSVLALGLVAAPPAGAGHLIAHPILLSDWSCSAIGLREGPRLPAPQRIFFSDKSTSKTAAEAGAMRKCKASHQVTSPRTCQAGTCSRAT
ncbi:MAG TPA: hypothetical protein VGI95_10260 [Caulobacteraceae bacterium]|jgi:hypothetical protein